MAYLANHDEEKARTVARKAIEGIESILNDACTMSVLTDRKKAEYTDRIEQLKTEMENGFCTYRMRIADNERQSVLLNRSFFEKVPHRGDDSVLDKRRGAELWMRFWNI